MSLGGGVLKKGTLMISLRKISLSASFAAALALSAATLMAIGASAEPVVGEAAPVFSGTTASGEPFVLEDYAGQTVVLEWTNHDCPYVMRQYGMGRRDDVPAVDAFTNMQNLQNKWGDDVVWVQVISSAPGKQGHVSGEEALAIAEARGAVVDAIVLDPTGAIGQAYGARTTPEMFVIEQGVVRYSGAIDDHGTARAAGLAEATNYVDLALTALANGDDVATVETTSYGCTVKY